MKDRNKVLFGFVMLLMVVGIIGFSYALFTTKVEKKGALNIVAGTVSCPIQIEGIEGNEITLVNQTEKEIEVTIRNDSKVPIHSTITYLKNENVEVLASNQNGDPINKESLSVGETRTYMIKLINKTNTTQTVTLNGRCGLSNKTLAIADTEEEITGNYERVEPNEPELVTGLIPVVYDESQSSWVKADTTKKWYNYDKQEWANAVTIGLDEDGVGTKKRESYMTAQAGELISIDDINTMWVWIPRYEYNYVSIKNAGGDKSNCTNSVVSNYECYLNPGEIKVNFINGTSNTPNNDYIVHPAFTFGDKELTGMWYGKFETSSKEECIAASGSVNTECDIETYTPEIKPSVTSWRGIRVSTAFEVSRRMQTTNYNIYGFSSSQTSYDTHMSKNSEWGAVAYLSQSKYGKYGNSNYGVDDKEVYINNCSNYITGIAGNTVGERISAETCKTNTYETSKGQKASTTGNITGVYDMSGGAWDRVMGALEDSNNSGKPTNTACGFFEGENGNKIPDKKYYDLYRSTDRSSTDGNLSLTACGEGVCYGHALSETLGWYGDYYVYVNYSGSWFNRGGGTYADASSTGVFLFYYVYGGSEGGSSFRLVLSPIGA